MTKTLTRRLVLLGVLTALAGCSTLTALSDASTPLSVFDLRAPNEGPVARGRPLPLDVVVELPNASGVLKTDRIMIRPDTFEVQYLPDVRWGDETPVMMQTLMLRALENSAAFRYVGRRPLAGSGDYAIVTELIDFQAELDESGEGAMAVLRMTSRIVRERDARIVASQTFVATAPSNTTLNADLVAAFDSASDDLLTRFSRWAVEALGGRVAS